MANFQYEGILESLFCGVCDFNMGFDEVENHECFLEAGPEDVGIRGNVINFVNQLHNNSERKEKENDTVKSLNIELDKNGEAVNSTHNSIQLAELVREERCIWDTRMPLSKRSTAIIADAWVKIAKNFNGWGHELTKRRFANLKSSLSRRNKVPPSGAGANFQRPWVVAPYLSFLDDVSADICRATVSNVPSTQNRVEDLGDESSQEYFTCEGECSDEEKEKAKKKTNNDNLGFPVKKAAGSKRKAKEDPLEAAIVQLAEKNSQKTPKKDLTPLQQWGMWLADEVSNFTDANDRLEVQGYITSYIAQKRREGSS